MTWKHAHTGAWRVSQVSPGPALQTAEFLQVQAAFHVIVERCGPDKWQVQVTAREVATLFGRPHRLR